MKKVCLYLRVSTNQQTTQNQELELKEYCKRQQWQITKIYNDVGISGSKFDRPALNEMLRDSEKGLFTVVVCFAIDRLGRSTIDLLQTLQRLQEAGVGFVATSQGLENISVQGRLLTQFLAVLSQWEKDALISRVRSGMARAKEQGISIGRPRVAIDIKQALKLRREGLGFKRIAKQMNIPKSTLYYCLEAVRQPSS